MNRILLPLLLLLTTATAALGASVSGSVKDENGQPLAGSVLCLSKQNTAPAAAPTCVQKKTSDASGAYAFSSVAAGAYVVTVSDERYPTFTWLPAARTLTLGQTDQTAGVNFARQFSFSNFQNPTTLRGSDLPELANFNLSQDTVFVKVYAVDPAKPSQQTVFFIGRVTSGDNLKFAASAPWAVKEVIYEIFSPTAARQGSLILGS